MKGWVCEKLFVWNCGRSALQYYARVYVCAYVCVRVREHLISTWSNEHRKTLSHYFHNSVKPNHIVVASILLIKGYIKDFRSGQTARGSFHWEHMYSHRSHSEWVWGWQWTRQYFERWVSGPVRLMIWILQLTMLIQLYQKQSPQTLCLMSASILRVKFKREKEK